MLLATQLLLKMRLWELLPFLVLFIFLWGIQEPKLAEGFFLSKYWGTVLNMERSSLMGSKNKTHCR